MRTVDSVKALLADSDPAADLVGNPARRQRDLEKIVLADRTDAAVPRPAVPVLRRKRLLVPLGALAAGAAAALVFGLLPGGTASTAHAVTPPLLSYQAPATTTPAPQLLEEIAQRTAALSEPDGPDAVLEWKEWSLFTRIDGNRVSSRVMAEDRKVVIHADGSGTLTRAFEGEKGKTEPHERGLYPDPVPADPDALRAVLRRSTPAVDDPAGAAEALRGLLRAQALSPGQRAAVLRLIAALPGLRHDGTVVDRAGRLGEAVSAESARSGLPSRYTFIIDPATGRILGDEDMLTESAGALNVPVPSVISYTSYLVAYRR
ncbi:CU044_5270 family protein [Kitasatospora sp. NPDC004615]|uniref:CU044_5270 family protein n=1 Tax=Kitasatospora sp. NPDC004615 TaxID=3364017 RepID=UPI0036814929